MNGENVEIFVLEMNDEGDIVQRFVKTEEINEFLKVVEKEEEEEKAKEAKVKKDF
jgi:hypothetical protein